MYKLRSTLPLMYFLMLMIMSGCNGEKPPSVITRHEAKYPEIRKKYLYQSIIRLANINHDPAFDELIKDVKKIIIYLPPREDSTYQITEVRSGMRDDGYEQLVDVRTKDEARVSLWVNESTPQPHYMGLLDTSDDDYIFEIDGQLNLEYISSLKMADQSSLLNFLKD